MATKPRSKLRAANGSAGESSLTVAGEFWLSVNDIAFLDDESVAFALAGAAVIAQADEAQVAVVGVPASRSTYALGSLVLWSADDGPAVLEANEFNKLSIAKPKLAPYGEAAMKTREALGAKEAVEPKPAMDENIAQAFQFVDTGNADLGFVALSQVMEGGEVTKGSAGVVPSDIPPPIRQDAVMLASGADDPAANALMTYLKGDQAQAIIHRFGYETERHGPHSEGTVPHANLMNFATFDQNGDGAVTQDEFYTVRGERMGQRAAQGAPMRGAASVGVPAVDQDLVAARRLHQRGVLPHSSGQPSATASSLNSMKAST